MPSFRLFPGGGDAIVHYRISHYAWTYPHLFLNLWGKPVFTLLSSPFAQLGFNGMMMFNVLVASLSAYVGFGILKLSHIKGKILLLPLLFFAPVYFIMVPSTMTEPLFGLFLMLGAWLFIREKYVSSLIIISLLPFVRNEGFIVFPFFILGLIHVRKYRLIPLILTGYLVIGAAGAIHSGDILWLINSTPYFGEYEEFRYKSGEFLSYIQRLPRLWGIPLLTLSILGSLAVIFRAVFMKQKEHLLLLLLVFLPAFTYILAHSFVYWRGMGGALGLDRIMSAVVPLAAVLGVAGFNLLVKRYSIAGKIILIIGFVWISFYMVKEVNDYYHLPLKPGPHENALERVSDWIEEQDLVGNTKVYYYHPYAIHALGLDPFDNEKSGEQIPVNEVTGPVIRDGGIIIWDTHFGPNEGRMPLDTLLKVPGVRKLKTFEEPLGEDTFRVVVLQKTDTSGS